MSLEKWDNLRPGIQEAKFVDELLQFAASLGDNDPVRRTGNKNTGTPTLAALISLCRGQCREGHVGAAELLGFAAERSTPVLGGFLDATILDALPDLIEMLAASSPDARIAAIKAIASFRESVTLDAVDAVTECIYDPCEQVQCEAIRAIMAFGLDKATTAVPRLTAILEGGVYAEVLLAACAALRSMGSEAKDAVGALVRVATDRSTSARIAAAAASALTIIDPDGCAVANLVTHRDDRDRLLRVLRGLGERGRQMRHPLEAHEVVNVRTYRTHAEIADAANVAQRTLQRYLKELGIKKTGGKYSFSDAQWQQLTNRDRG